MSTRWFLQPRVLSGVTRLAAALAAGACAGHVPFATGLDRPPALAGEWIDLRHTTPGDTALWVLGTNGYDGSARLIADVVQGTAVTRTQRRYGSWYLSGTLADTSGRAICFARRIGRDGATCVAFTLDTIWAAGSLRRHLVVHGYEGQHHTGDRELLERAR